MSAVFARLGRSSYENASVLSKPKEEPTWQHKLKAIELSGDHIGMFGKNRGPGSVTVQLVLTENEFKY
jgi:hypothetical protein